MQRPRRLRSPRDAWTNSSRSPARESQPEHVVEIDTYRYRGHSVADPDNTYRSKQEIEEYRNTKDPIQVFQQQLVAEGVLDEATDREDRHRGAAPRPTPPPSSPRPARYPTVDDIQKDVYWEADNPAERKSQGRLFFD